MRKQSGLILTRIFPVLTRRCTRKAKLLFVVCILSGIHIVYADDICRIQGGGILDGMITQFGNAASGWQTQINPIAKKLFFILFGMEFMWQLAVKKVFAGDVEKLWVFFFTRTVLCFFFAKYIVNVALYQDVIMYMSKLGSQLGGFVLNINPSQNFTTLSPSAVVSQFTCLADSIHKISDPTSTLHYITLKFTLAIMQVMLLVILSLIAYSMMKIMLQTYFLLYVGFLLTGFAGSSWTMDYWKRYIQGITGVAIKFLTMCFLMGVLVVQMKSWAPSINAATSVEGLGSAVLKILGSGIIMALIANQLPDWAAQTLAGGVNMQMANALAPIANFMSGRNVGGGNSSSSEKQSNTSPTPISPIPIPKEGDLSQAPMKKNPLSEVGNKQNSMGTSSGTDANNNIFQTIAASRNKES